MKRAASCATSLLALCLLAGVLASSTVSASSLSESVQPLFSATDSFLDLVQPVEKSFLLREVAPQIINGTYWDFWRRVDVSLKAREYVQSMLGYAILVCLGVVLIVLVPLIGCCVCCCRCCCSKCGGGRRSYKEHKGAKCRRAVYGLFFLIFVTFVLFGAVLALVSNQLLRDQFPPSSPDGSSAGSGALDAVSGSLGAALDAVTSLPGRGREVTPRIVSDVAGRVRPSLNRTLTTFQAILINSTGAGGAIEAARLAIDKLGVAQNQTLACADGHAALQGSATVLNQTLNSIRDSYRRVDSCPAGANPIDCRTVNDSLNFYFAEQLPGAAVLDETKGLLNRQSAADLRQRLDKAWAGMTNITNAGMEMVDKLLADAQSNLNRSELIKVWDNLDNSLSGAMPNVAKYRNISQLIVFNPITRTSVTLGNLASELDGYRYYVYLGLGCLVLLFVALFYLGLMWGCAGEPPHEDAGCCNRGVGANFLLAGAGLTFLFYALLMLIVMLQFLAGGIMQTEACRYLRNRPGTNGYSLLDEIAVQTVRRGAFGNVTFDLTRPVSTLLTGCSAPNGSLTSVVNVSQILGGLGLPAKIDGFLNNAQVELVNRAADFVPQDAFNFTQLRDLLEQAVNATSYNFTSYKSQVSQALGNSALSSLKNALFNISRDATNSTDRSRFLDYHSNLTQAVAAANALQSDQSARVDQLVTALNALTGGLIGLPNRIAAVGVALRSPDILLAAFNASTVGLSQELQDQAVRALDRLLGEILDCNSLGRLLRQVIEVPCVRILQPFNGFWSGIGICLLGLLPCLLLSIKLANLYRKKHKYRPDVEDRATRSSQLTTHSSVESKL